jgi:hypothetical protein
MAGLVPAIHVLPFWMPGTRPGMTNASDGIYRRSTAIVRLAKVSRSAMTETK